MGTLLANLGAFFRWHALRDANFVNPIVPGMGRQTIKGKPRERILNDDEIHALWAATTAGGTYNSIIRTLLLTASRLNESAQMSRTEIDRDGVWTIPADGVAQRASSLASIHSLISTATRAI